MTGLYALAGVLLGALLSFFGSVIGTLVIKRAKTRQTARLRMYDELLPAVHSGKGLWRYAEESQFHQLSEDLMKLAAASLLTGSEEIERIERIGRVDTSAERVFVRAKREGKSEADVEEALMPLAREFADEFDALHAYLDGLCAPGAYASCSSREDWPHGPPGVGAA